MAERPIGDAVSHQPLIELIKVVEQPPIDPVFRIYVTTPLAPNRTIVNGFRSKSTQFSSYRVELDGWAKQPIVSVIGQRRVRPAVLETGV